MKAVALSLFFALLVTQHLKQVRCTPIGETTTEEENVDFRESEFPEEEETHDFDSEETGVFRVLQHNKELNAVVFKPSSYGSDPRNFFKSKWEENERTGEENDIVPEIPYTSQEREYPSSSEEDDEEKFIHGIPVQTENATEYTDDNTTYVDPLDPEELNKHKQEMEGHDVFWKILEINKEAGLEGVTQGDMRTVRPRNAAGDVDLWPKSRSGSGQVMIPYKISSVYNKTEVNIIKSAMALYSRHTCVRFIPREKSEIAYIYISDGKGCWAYVGKTGYSAQTVSLGRPGCVAKGIAAHELMHVVGFQHEHSRSDRDKFVTIVEHNIQKDMRSNFEIYNNTRNLVVYDYNSVMHYSKNAFSKFQYLPAIQVNPKRKPEPSIGQRERMSPYDIEEIKYLYKCESHTYHRCGIDFVNRNSGQLKSPKYPNNYPPEAHCTWRITVPKGRYVVLNFAALKVNLEDSPLCQNDAILIHDGETAAAPQLKVLCGSPKKAVRVTSTGNAMFVMFTSDPTKNSFKGFEATFKTTSTPGVAPTPLVPPTLQPVQKLVDHFTCKFDQGLCGMSQDTLDELDWIRYKGRTPSHGTGPSADHTTGSGYYMYVESSLPSKVGDNAILRTPWMERKPSICVTFSYHMLGSYMGTLRLYAYEKRKGDDYGHEVLLWEKHGNKGNRWITESVGYNLKASVERVQYYWEAFVFFYQSDFGLDDVTVKNSPCQSSSVRTTPPRVQVMSGRQSTRPATTTTPKTTMPTTQPTTTSTTSSPPIAAPLSESFCNFENGLCDWTQDNKDNFDWTLTNKGTPSHNTGPTADHTGTETGYFMFIEASTPRVDGDVARLLSPPLTRKPHCLRIWYHMYGAQMGGLLISQITDGVEAKLVEKVGNKGDQWFMAEVDIVTPGVKTANRHVTKGSWHDDSFTQVAIDGIRGSGYPGDLAIDDIDITSSACAKAPAVVTPGLIRDLSCDFDVMNDTCGFTDSESDSFDWQRTSGETPSKATGPDNDHTKGDETGSYMYIEASSPHAKGDNAKLVSPKLESGSYCVRFYANMWGSGMGTFKAYTLEYIDTKNEFQRTRWELTGSQGKDWFKVEFEFETAINIKYVQVEFEATIGPSFTSDIALDDITVTPGRCGKDGTDTTSANSKLITDQAVTATNSTKGGSTPNAVTTGYPSVSTSPTIVTKSTVHPRVILIRSTTSTPTSKPITARRISPQASIKLVKPATTTKQVATSLKPTTPKTTRPTTQAVTTTKQPETTQEQSTTPSTPTNVSSSAPATTVVVTTTAKNTKTNSPDTTTKSQTTKPTTQKKPVTKTSTTATSRRVVQTTAAVTTTPRKATRATTKKTTTTRRTRPVTTPRPKTTNAKTTRATTTKPTTAVTTTKAPPPKIMDELTCNFENGGMCGFVQSNLDKFDWIMNSGNTPSSGTGPSYDRTYRTRRKGHYLFIEASTPRKPADNAIIISPPLSTKSPERCVLFWYHMYGDGIGSLKVYSKYSHSRNVKKRSGQFLEFEMSGDLGNQWKMAQFTVKRRFVNPQVEWQFFFEGIVGKKFRSDIAIDDICIMDGPCTRKGVCRVSDARPSPKSPPAARIARPTTSRGRTTKATTTPKPSTKPTPAAKPVTPSKNLLVQMPPCSFDLAMKKAENSKSSSTTLTILAGVQGRDLGSYEVQKYEKDVMCGWEQEKTGDQFDWVRQTGSTPSQFTGPKGDHTTGKGYYLFIESSVPRVFNDMAILKSKKLHPTTYCVDFYYNMYGKGTGALQVRSKETLTDNTEAVRYLKAIRGEQGEPWGRLRITYKPKKNTKDVQFRIEGIRGKDYMGDIAIDDLQVSPGRCGSCMKPTQSYVNQWRQKQSFTTGCITSELFYVKCCSLADEKHVFRKVSNCTPAMYKANKLDLMCNYL